MTVTEYILDYIDQSDIHHVFGMSGANIEILFRQMHEHPGIKPVIAKHESAAVTMAEGYFHKTGKPGIVMATSGGGAFNLLSPLIECLSSSVPIVAIVGQIPTQLEGIGGFQDSSGIHTPVDSQRIFNPATVYCRKVKKASDVPVLLLEAMKAAILQRGPALLLLPRDLQLQDLGDIDPAKYLFKKGKEQVDPDQGLLNEIRQMISVSSKIMVIAGKEILLDKASADLKEFVERTGARVALTPDAKAAFDHYSPNFAGIAGVMGHGNVFKHLRDADLCILAGTRLPLMSRFGIVEELLGKKVVTLNRNRAFINNELGTNIWHGIDNIHLKGPAGNSLKELNILLPEGDKKIHPEREEPEMIQIPMSPELSLNYRDSVKMFSRFIQSGEDIFVDAGNTGAALIHYLPYSGEGVFSVALGMGGMGYSFGAAIGSAVASGNRTWVFAGDGSFYMHGLEIHTAIELGLPICFVIFDNRSHAMCHIREELYLGGKSGDQVFKEAHIAEGLSKMFPELIGFEAYDPDELFEALEQCTSYSGVSVISVHISPEDMPPFIPFINEYKQISANAAV